MIKVIFEMSSLFIAFDIIFWDACDILSFRVVLVFIDAYKTNKRHGLTNSPSYDGSCTK